MPENPTRTVAGEPSIIQTDIERAREEITNSVLALRERVYQATDWREWTRRRPWIALTLVFALGVWLGTRRKK